MHIFLETISGLERRLTIVIPAEKIDGEISKRLQNISHRIRLDGFRPGKIPMKIVKRRYGLSTRQEVLGEQMQKAFVKAITKNNLKPAGMPIVELKMNAEGKNFEFSVIFEVYPEIKLNNFSAVQVERPVANVIDADINRMITTLHGQDKSFEDVERAAQLGDQVIFDYGIKGDKEFEIGHVKHYTLELGSGQMIQDLEDSLVGMSAGEEKTLKLTVSEDNNLKNLQGQTIECICKVYKVQKAIVNKLHDKFCKRFGVVAGCEEAFDDEEAFRTAVRKHMERELRQAIKNKIKNQVMNGLLNIHEMQVPSSLITQEIAHMREQAVKQCSFDPKELTIKLFEKDAKKRVALGLLVDAVVKQYEIQVDDDRVRSMINEIAAAYQEPQKVVDWYYNNEEHLSQVKYVLLEEQVVNTILNSANISERQCSYQEAIKLDVFTETEEAKSVE